MSYAAYNRIRGFVVLMTGALTILFNALLWTNVIPRTWEYPGYLILQSLFLFSLVSVLVHHIAHPGILLLAGFVLATLDLIFGFSFSYYASFAFPILRDQFPDAVSAVLGGPVGSISMISMALGIVGNILFYSGVLRSGIVPRWAPIVVIISQLLGLAMLPYNIPVILACVGLVGIGYSMMSQKTVQSLALEPHPAT